MTLHKVSNNGSEYDNLLALGIPADVIDQANVSEISYRGLFKLLKAPMRSMLTPRLIISSPWQLEALTGQMTASGNDQRDNLGAGLVHYALWSGRTTARQWAAKNFSGRLMDTDQYGRTCVHYAAWSGNPAGLQWIAKRQPDVLIQRSKLKLTIAHYAAWSGKPEALQWIVDHQPALLKLKTNLNLTIAHYAAWSGNPKALQWIAEHQPALLTLKTSLNLTIAHYAAWSGNPEALQWVADNQKALLTHKSKDGLSITHFAAMSGNPESLNKAFSLSETPYSFTVKYHRRETDTVIRTFLRTLDDNFTLTEGSWPSCINPKSSEDIAILLSRNQAITSSTLSFSVLAFCFHQKGSKAATGLITPDILFEIFKKLIPEEVPIDRIRNAFYRINYSVSASSRLEHKKNLIMRSLSKSYLPTRHANLFQQWGLIGTNEAKITVRENLTPTLLADQSLYELKQSVIRYYLQHETIINHQRNPIHAFFSPNHKTATRRMFDEIFDILDIKVPDISTAVP